MQMSTKSARWNQFSISTKAFEELPIISLRPEFERQLELLSYVERTHNDKATRATGRNLLEIEPQSSCQAKISETKSDLSKAILKSKTRRSMSVH